MRLSNLTLGKIQQLDGLESDTLTGLNEEILRLSKATHNTSQSVKVQHRELSYTVGRWDSWEGSVWLVEDRTGIVYKGTFTDVSEFLVLCSAAFHEPHAIKP